MILIGLSVFAYLDLVFLIKEILNDLNLDYHQFSLLKPEAQQRIINKIFTIYITGIIRVRLVILVLLAAPMILITYIVCLIIYLVKGMFGI